jgi:hypothetical protein
MFDTMSISLRQGSAVPVTGVFGVVDATTGSVAVVCEQIRDTQTTLRAAEWQELALAAHWADLHGPQTRPDLTDRALPGAERLVVAGGAGTPRITEFACAELGVLMGTGFIAASALIRDAVDLRHRHPVLWQALSEGRGRVWKARRVARMAHAAELTREQAAFLDETTTPYIDSLTWSAFTRLVEAKIIEADPAAAEARRLAAAMQRFVTTGRSDEHGLQTLIARATAGEVIYLVAMVDRIAHILALQGDTDPADVRRATALGILAHPARALALLTEFTTDEPHPDDPDRQPLQREPRADEVTGRCADCGGPRIDPERLRPNAVLYVRVSEQSLLDGAGVAHCEGLRPTTVAAIRDLLMHHRVSIRPVLDLRDQVPVEAYEVPHAMREALRLARPSSVFPWTRTGTTTPDIDHTDPYVPGSATAQTRIANLGPMVRFGHRVKTFGRGWAARQPAAGTYLFRTPHGYWTRVDNDGTHYLGGDPDLDLDAHAPPVTDAELDRALEGLLARV